MERLHALLLVPEGAGDDAAPTTPSTPVGRRLPGAQSPPDGYLEAGIAGSDRVGDLGLLAERAVVDAIATAGGVTREDLVGRLPVQVAVEKDPGRPSPSTRTGGVRVLQYVCTSAASTETPRNGHDTRAARDTWPPGA